MNPKPTTDQSANLELLLDVPVAVSVRLGSCQLSMRDVLQLGPGSIVQLDKLADSPVEVFVNDKLVARGEVVVLENRFGVKIIEMVGQHG